MLDAIQASKPNHQPKLYFLVFVWFSICTALILWFSSANKSAFDSNLILSQAIMSLEFEQDFVKVLRDIESSKQKQSSHQTDTIFHIRQGDCYCEWLASRHQGNIDAWAQDHHVNTRTLNINDYPELRRYIPSTPAIVVVDKQNALRYLGPYSRGSGCFSASGKVDEYLSQWQQSASSSSENTLSIIDTDASGCYCSS